ncbi:MAG: hypothetical protein WCI37_02885, partial [bacterium]
GLGTTVYNGYIYAIGGQAGASTGDCTATSNYCNGTWYAQINANGSIGSWASAGTFAGGMPARSGLGTTVYNGYIYAIGGQAAAASTGDCTATSNYCNGTWYAQINANGTLGTWTSTTTFATTTSGTMPARSGLGTTVYNGYIYVLGGFSAGCPSINTSVCNDTWYAQINANGTLGSWTPIATATFPAEMGPRASFGTAVYNGYIYALGGFSSNIGQTTHGTNCSNNILFWTVCNDTWYAQINATDGTIGSWTSAGTFASGMPARYGLGTAVYNGYIFVIGGCNNTTPNTTNRWCYGSLTGGIYSAPISTSGIVGTFSNTGTTITSLMGSAVVAYNNTIYVVSGCSGVALNYGGCSAVLNGVRVLTISGGSVTASYTDGGTTLTGVWGASAVINNGYVYLIGGCKANLNTTTALGMCNNGTTSQTNATNSIQYAPLPSGGGKINQAFSSATVNGLTAAFMQSAVVYNNYLYVIGGTNGSNSSSILNTIQYAPFVNSGATTSFTFTANTTNLNSAVFSEGAIVTNGYLEVFGGCAAISTVKSFAGCGTISNNVYSIALKPSGGTKGSWQTNATLSDTIWAFGYTGYNGNIVTVGGCNTAANATYIGCGGQSNNTIYTTPVNTGNGDGSLKVPTNCTLTNGSFCQLSSIESVSNTYPIYGAASAVFNGYLYIVGGVGNSNDTNCYTLGNMIANSQVICNTARVYNITNNGSINFKDVYGLSLAKYNETLTAYNNKLYLIGGLTCYVAVIGCSDITGVSSDDVQMVNINSDGSLPQNGSLTSVTPSLNWPSSTNANSICTAYQAFWSTSCLSSTSIKLFSTNSLINPGTADGTYNAGDGVKIANSPYNGSYYVCLSNCLVQTTNNTTNLINSNPGENGANYCNTTEKTCCINTSNGVEVTPDSTLGAGQCSSSIYAWVSICLNNSTANNCYQMTGSPYVGSYNGSSSSYNFGQNSIGFVNNGYLFVTSSGSGTGSNYSAKINNDGTLATTGSVLANGSSTTPSYAYYNKYLYEWDNLGLQYSNVSDTGGLGTWKTESLVSVNFNISSLINSLYQSYAPIL